MQTRRQSLFEAFINILIGLGVAVTAQTFIFPLYGIHIPLSQDIEIAMFFTAVSLVRSYWLRRLFNKIHSIQDKGVKV